MLGEIRGEVRFKEPLSFHTSLRIGGAADIFVVPQDVEDIRLALSFAEREQLPVEVVGGGNNLLASDRGFRGVVLKLEGCLGRADFHGEEAVAGAGVSPKARASGATPGAPWHCRQWRWNCASPARMRRSSPRSSGGTASARTSIARAIAKSSRWNTGLVCWRIAEMS